MLNGWKGVALGEVLTLQRGFDLPSQQRRPGTVPVVSSSGVSGTHAESKVPAPGVVTGRYGTLGDVFLVESDFWPLNTTLFVKDFKGNDPRFVYYLLKGLDLSAYNDKSSVPGVNRNHLHTMPVRVPHDLGQQRAIAHILGTLDDKIELNRRTTQTLDALARALFTSWFVAFDPVRAKAEGRHPVGMDADTAALFPSEFENSVFGMIPRGWAVKAVSDLATINTRMLGLGDLPISLRYIEISGVQRGEVTEVTTYERGTEPSRARRRLLHGDTVMSTVRPDRQSYFLALWPDDDLVASTGFAVITAQAAPWGFLHAALTRQPIFEYLGRIADGGAYPAVRPEIIGALQLVVPSDKRVALVFQRIIGPLYERASRNRDESRLLANIRDALLPRLLSGELRVPDAERLLAQEPV